MKKASKNHIKNSALLGATVIVGQGLSYKIAEASNSGKVKVETIELDFQQKTTAPGTQQYSDAAAKTLGAPNQFIFLFALTILGLVGIAGLIKDFRQR